jgi:hypothetical protein
MRSDPVRSAQIEDRGTVQNAESGRGGSAVRELEFGVRRSSHFAEHGLPQVFLSGLERSLALPGRRRGAPPSGSGKDTLVDAPIDEFKSGLVRQKWGLAF